MRIDELLKSEQELNQPNKELTDFEKGLFRNYLQEIERSKDIKSNPFEFFFEDVINEKLKNEYKTVLGDSVYKLAEHDARACLETCNEFKKLNSYKLQGWLSNALKFADHFVLFYIQECMKTKPLKYDNCGDEKSRYKQLEETAENRLMNSAGSILKNLYDARNKFEHRTKIHEDGRQELMRPPVNKVYREVKKFYPNVLLHFESAFLEI